MRISDWSSDVCSSDLQGVVSFIESGWRRMPAFTPAACRIRFDLRLSPRTSAEEADRAVDMQLQTIAARHGLDLSWRRLVTIPGTTPAPGHLIIRPPIQASEHVRGPAPPPPPGMSRPPTTHHPPP